MIVSIFHKLRVKITDARGNTTSFTRDLESRVTSKVYADTTHVDTAYDTIGRVSLMTDARGDTSTPGYNLDNTVAAMAYSVTGTTAATANGTFTYDAVYK